MTSEVKQEAGIIEAASEEILKLLETYPDGIDKEVLVAMTPSTSAEDRLKAINGLLAASKVEMMMLQGGNFRLQLSRGTQLTGVTAEEQLVRFFPFSHQLQVYSLIEESHTKGIWIRELRDGSGLSQLQLRKILKTLEQKKLVKAIKAVGSTKKCYMTFNLEADSSLTGGTFYSDQQLDSELINTLLNLCVAMLESRRKAAFEQYPNDPFLQREAACVPLSEVVAFVRDKKVLHVNVTDTDIERILSVADLDGTVERRLDGRFRSCPRAISACPLVSVPCIHCPLIDDCQPGHEISPHTCEYFTEWLANN